jgi:hypothetical protein
MPTGYTAAVSDGSVTTLKDYALCCARAFGALIHMRDEPSDTPVPRQLVADISYYDKRIIVAEQELSTILAMTPEELDKAVATHNEEVLRYNEETIQKYLVIRKRYEDMISMVETWHGGPEGLKEFMLQQLRDSLSFDVPDDPLRWAETTKTVMTWYDDRVKELRNVISNGRKSRDEEIARVAARNKWLDQLFTSLT